MQLIDPTSAPSHLSAIAELDLSADMFADPLADAWIRLAAHSKSSAHVNARGVRDVTDRQALLIEIGAFEVLESKLDSIGNKLRGMGQPGGAISTAESGDKTYRYHPFYAFDIGHSGIVGEPLAFEIEHSEGTRLMLNPDVALYFKLEENPLGSGALWDPSRSVDVVRIRWIDGDEVQIIEMRKRHLMKYLSERQRALLIGHYRHLHFLDPPQGALDSFVEGDVVLRSARAKALIQNGVKSDGMGERLLVRRLNLWFAIEPPGLEIDRVFEDEPEFDITSFTLPVSKGEAAPGLYRHPKGVEAAAFKGVRTGFLDRVYFRQDVLARYQGASGFEIGDDGSVRNRFYWGLDRGTHRVGNELLSTNLGDFAEGVPYEEWSHWRQYAVEPPSLQALSELDKEQKIPEAVNAVASALEHLNDAFARLAHVSGVAIDGPLWRGALDSLAGRQLKWIYPSDSDDGEFLTRATLASTLVIDSLNSAVMRDVLVHFGEDLHRHGKDSLGSRNLLQRLMLIAELVLHYKPCDVGLADLLGWSVEGKGAPSDLQFELTRDHEALRAKFAPLAFLYDLRIHGGLAHPPNAKAAGTAARNLGLADKGWRRADYLMLLARVVSAVDAVTEPIERLAEHLAHAAVSLRPQ